MLNRASLIATIIDCEGSALWTMKFRKALVIKPLPSDSFIRNRMKVKPNNVFSLLYKDAKILHSFFLYQWMRMHLFGFISHQMKVVFGNLFTYNRTGSKNFRPLCVSVVNWKCWTWRVTWSEHSLRVLWSCRWRNCTAKETICYSKLVISTTKAPPPPTLLKGISGKVVQDFWFLKVISREFPTHD